MARGHLSRRLDREMYQVVNKLIGDESLSLSSLDVTNVYNSIQRSNSSLKRTPKRLLEDSIQRVLDTIEEDKSGSETIEEQEAEKEKEKEEDESQYAQNSLNRSIVRAWNFNNKSSSTRTSDTKATNNIPSKKHSIDMLPESSAKRSKRAQMNPADFPPPEGFQLEDIGGMDSTLKQCKKLLVGPLRLTHRYIEAGINVPRGILFHGPPGCGKTMLCEALASALNLPFQYVSAPSVISGISGDSEKAIREKFDTAIKIAPSIMFIDEIDAITPKRDGAQREMDRRVVAQLLTCMDGLALNNTAGKPVIVLAATNRPDSLDPALRRAGRFDTEIHVETPNIQAREAILLSRTRNISKISSNVDFKRLAKLTSGYVGADLQSLVDMAGGMLEERYIQALHDRYGDSVEQMDIDMVREGGSSRTVAEFRREIFIIDSGLIANPLENFDDVITMDDFLQALTLVQPSAKREGFATTPDTTWADIGALKDVRKALEKILVQPISNPELYEDFNIANPSGVLLWGPPGCGKTMLAKAVANQCNASFISVKGPELLNKYVGESERAVRQVFLRARSATPCIIFFDEVDALVPKRSDMHSEATERVVNQLLTELDGIDSRKGIYVIAATNRPDRIDRAILRGGRIGRHLYVGLPGVDERVEILKTLLQKTPSEPGIAESIAQSEKCNGFSGADLQQLVVEAAYRALGRNAKVVNSDDFHQALEEVHPSIPKEEVKKFERLKTTLTSDFRE